MNTDHRIYLKFKGKKVIGFLKIGKKKLFIRDEIGNIKEISPMCVLDFYVHESQQRSGVGKILFDKMLENENTEPRKLGYDRPSNKLIGFLGKHYGLIDYVPQNNNFVVYKKYFDESENIENNFNKRDYHYRKIDLCCNEISNNKDCDNEIYLKKKVTNLHNKFNNLFNRKINVDEQEDFEYLNKFEKININSDKPIHQLEKSNYNFEPGYTNSKNTYVKNSNFPENKKKSDEFEYNKKENTVRNLGRNPPWATNDLSNYNIASSSSSYGSYYTSRKKTNY
jgi:hypothetical protein